MYEGMPSLTRRCHYWLRHYAMALTSARWAAMAGEAVVSSALQGQSAAREQPATSCPWSRRKQCQVVRSALVGRRSGRVPDHQRPGCGYRPPWRSRRRYATPTANAGVMQRAGDIRQLRQPA